MDVHLTLVPVDKLGRFRAELDGQRITKATRQPFFEAARELLKLGWAPETAMIAMHAGSGTVAMRSTIGEAAKWTIGERDRGGLRRILWKPFEMGRSSDAVEARAAGGFEGELG